MIGICSSPDGRWSLEETSELLDQAQEKAEALPPRHGDIGHNQGPRLVDEEAQRRLEETIKNAFAALAKGENGATERKQAAAEFSKWQEVVLTGVIGGLAEGLVSRVLEEGFHPIIYDPTLHILYALFQVIQLLVVALMQ